MRIYIAGPYTQGDVALNVRAAIEAGQRLTEAGHTPFIPHLFHFWHLLFPGSYGQWTRIDLEWLAFCEAFVRLPGESRGADEEEQRAVALGIPVFRGVRDFLADCAKATLRAS